jgi:hypothetical protein
MTLILNNSKKLYKLNKMNKKKNIVLLVHADWCNTSKEFITDTWSVFKKVIYKKKNYKKNIKIIELDSKYLIKLKNKSKFLNSTLTDFKAYPTTIFISLY